MSDIEREITQRVVQWAEYADEDLRLARHTLTLSTAVPWRLVAYHAQQCVEKYLKAYLLSHQVDFPYTHNISLLLELCDKLAKWPEQLRDAESLSRFAITTRYPGDRQEVSREEALQAIELSAKVRETVRKVLAEEGHPMGQDKSL